MKPIDSVYFLLVDDTEENLISLEALLRREGLVMLKARSGPEALEILLHHEVALALLDVRMPGMDGFELAELIRGTRRTQNIPIIFLTAEKYGYTATIQGYEAGAVDFLYKPVESDILRSKANIFFELYQQQQQIKLQRDKLQVALEENANLLKESKQYAEALQEADRRKDEFLATLAHELRNPLAPIRNGLQILRTSSEAEIITNVRDMMDRQVAHMVRLIDDLLDVARVSQGKIVLQQEKVTVQTVLQAAIEVSRSDIEEHGHTFTMDIPKEPLWLNADLTRIAQVVSNLLNNASKYTPKGGKISLSAYLKEGNVAITVSDNGSGIPSEMLPKVFDLFTQVDRNLERSQSGLGIGLALVKQLVTIHGGTIDAKSEGLGKGSEFTVYLPLSSADGEALLPDKGSLPTTPAAEIHLNILVVDDNEPSAKTLGWMLEIMGHQSQLANNGATAITIAKEACPDVILLDIGLPDMNGYDVCREMRKVANLEKCVIIAQTGWGQEKDRQLAKEAGFDYHLLKPINFEEFSKLLSEIARKSHHHFI